jgi:hypothetical protein
MDKKPWGLIVALGWLIPGAGHILLKKYYRGAIIGGCVLLSFLFGLMMRGSMFEPQTGDLLTTLIYVGGFIADAATGILFILAKLLGYDQPDVAGAVYDYGTKFIVAAGLFNILACVDAYEIATGKKD